MEPPRISPIIRPGRAVQLMLDQLNSDLANDRLRLLSLPNVAANVGRALSMGGLSPAQSCQYLMLDPVLAAKLIKRANRSKGTALVPACTCQEASQRLGSEAVFQLVAQSALREVMRGKQDALMQAMQRYRQRALRVSAISYVLACSHGGFDPGFAALAGLMHNIGDAAILSYARAFPVLNSDPRELKLCRLAYGADIGRRLLTRWNLNPQLIMVAGECANWERKAAGAGDYVDLVQIALWLALLNERARPDLIERDRLTAIARLGLEQRLDELGSNILCLADKTSACAEQALSISQQPAF